MSQSLPKSPGKELRVGRHSQWTIAGANVELYSTKSGATLEFAWHAGGYLGIGGGIRATGANHQVISMGVYRGHGVCGTRRRSRHLLVVEITIMDACGASSPKIPATVKVSTSTKLVFDTPLWLVAVDCLYLYRGRCF